VYILSRRLPAKKRRFAVEKALDSGFLADAAFNFTHFTRLPPKCKDRSVGKFLGVLNRRVEPAVPAGRTRVATVANGGDRRLQDFGFMAWRAGFHKLKKLGKGEYEKEY